MFQLDLKNRKPIYEQIVENFKELIINRVLKPDEKIPSVRDLAKQLTINPNTIQKSYRELENQGYIYSVKGLGSFISERSHLEIDKTKEKNLKEQIKSSTLELLYMGTNPNNLEAFIKQIISSWRGGEQNDWNKKCIKIL